MKTKTKSKVAKKSSKTTKRTALTKLSEKLRNYTHATVVSFLRTSSRLVTKVSEATNGYVYNGKHLYLKQHFESHPGGTDFLMDIFAQLKKRQTLLLFSDRPVSAKSISALAEEESYAAGVIADRTFVLEEGLSNIGKAHLDRMRDLGVHSELREGKVAVRTRFSVCEAGQTLTKAQSYLLNAAGFVLQNRLEVEWERELP